ncbi:MAG: ribonuclease P protein component [Gemmatimonadales bacterium]
MTAERGFPRAYRLANSADIRHCLLAGRRSKSGSLEMIWTDNTAGHPRMGLIVPRFQSTAVARNCLRRRLKEIWRRDLRERQPAWDLVIRARREAYGTSFQDLRADLAGWAEKYLPPVDD